jgi:hypothetical protein
MAVTILNIIPRKQAEATQTGQYTSNGVKTIIDKFTATNTSGSAVTFSVNLVAASGSAGDSNLVLKEYSIAAGACYLCPELVGQTLEPGGFISTLASDANAITISASGRQIS